MKRYPVFVTLIFLTILLNSVIGAQTRPDTNFKSIHQLESETHKGDTTKSRTASDVAVGIGVDTRVMANVTLMVLIIVVLILALAVLLIIRRVYHSKKIERRE